MVLRLLFMLTFVAREMLHLSSLRIIAYWPYSCLMLYFAHPLTMMNVLRPSSKNWMARAASRMPRMREKTRMPVRPIRCIILVLLRITNQAITRVVMIAAATESKLRILGVARST